MYLKIKSKYIIAYESYKINRTKENLQCKVIIFILFIYYIIIVWNFVENKKQKYEQMY